MADTPLTTQGSDRTPTSTASTPQAQVLTATDDHKQLLASASSRSSNRAATVSLEGLSTTFKSQAGALFRKNAVYQRRNWLSNLCLLSAPVFFCMLLFLLQVAVNRLLLSGEDYQCGCKCTQCCYQGNLNNCTETAFGPCQGRCLQRDTKQCGVQFSTARQAFFCSIAHTTAWPALLQAPYMPFRALPQRPRLAMLYTGKDVPLADKLAAELVPKPNLTLSSLTRLQSYQRTFSKSFPDASVIPAEMLSQLGFLMGSSSKIGPAGMFVEPGLIANGGLDAIWPRGACSTMGFDDKARDISMVSMVSGMINASNSPAAAAAINAALAGSFKSNLGNLGAAGVGAVTALVMNCTEADLLPLPTADAIQRQVYCGYRQARCTGTNALNEYTHAYDFGDTSLSTFAPNVYYNDTYGNARNGAPAVYQRLTQSLNMAINAWLKVATGGASTAQLLAVQEMPKPAGVVRLDFSSLLGPLFFTWVLQLLLPIYLMQLVYEKEKRLRMMMKMHGLGDTAYWSVTYVWFLVLYCAYLAVFLIFGSVIGLNMFRKNNYLIQIITYLLQGNNMIASAFLLSCFFSSSRTATVFAYLVVFGTGIVGQLLLGPLADNGRWYVWLLQLHPSFALYRALYEFGAYSFLAVYKDSFGLDWKNLSDPGNGLWGVWVILSAEWVWFMVLAWYLEQVFASGTGNKKHPLFFLNCFTKKHRFTRSSGGGSKHVVSVVDEPPDVALEHARVSELTDYVDNPIVIRDMRKVYPGLDGQPPKVAVRTLNLAIERGECFGLLGPNGAGKSTSINMMVGLLTPSDGTATIGGYDITRDMDAIYHLMGVCPQHDLLWETLTGYEHLLFYGRLKGYSGSTLVSAVEAGLRSVNLWSNGVGHKQARAYSGGMKRRLSVAISFMGSPLVVYLDEPSTGLDPASRRNLWEVVKRNKKDRAIVLTTHSMEEAEMLCDRLGIFVDGQLVCIGNPKELTSRYGGYLVFTITVPAAQEAAAREFVLKMSPNARLTYAVGGTLKFELPTSEVTLAAVFSQMAEVKQQLAVLDWAVANATLEEVFIKFARQIGAKAGE